MSHAIFYEAIAHSRRKTELKAVLVQFQDLAPYAALSVEEVFQRVSTLCTIGPLHVYDIAAAICRYHHINIDKVFIVGRGPKRAVRLLQLATKRHNGMHYVELSDAVKALTEQGATDIPTENGDDMESYLCKWQRNQ